MPSKKNPQKSSGASGKGQTTPVPGSEHVVFGKGSGGSKPQDIASGEPQAPPRPDARKVIGGASWTGKLPVNLLSELCQRQKWNKPEYSMRQMPAKEADQERHYRSAVTLSTTHPKTRETTTLPPFQLPLSQAHLGDQKTALEARHFAATYALFRVASMKNVHMTLPPQYRDLWKDEFARLKQEDVADGRGWKYDSDPFAAEAKRHEIQADMQKRKADEEKTKAKAVSLGLTVPGGVVKWKEWNRAPKIELGERMRRDIERVVKNDSLWNPYNVHPSTAERTEAIQDLRNRGFRTSHIEEALGYCRDREEALAWLLIHVPEDDLPRWSFPPGYSAGVSLAGGDLSKEAKLIRLAETGYSKDFCAQALHDSGGIENSAAEILQLGLVGGDEATKEEAGNSSDDIWEEEMCTLQAILGERFTNKTSSTCAISSGQESKVTYTLRFGRPSGGYPTRSVPIISIEAKSLPAFVRLSAVRQMVYHGRHSCLGDSMIFSLLEWFETNLQSVIDDPGPLQDIRPATTATSSFAQTASATEFKIMVDQRKIPRKNRTDERDELILSQWSLRQASQAQQQMTEARRKLPAWRKQQEIIDTIVANQVVLITGETGSGKSTQSVQFILDDLIQKNHGASANILCTQPRRISALGLSDRVSHERCSKEGDEVGYVIRGESKVSSRTRITFLTTGVLLRRMQSSGGIREALAGITHIFVDEVHERSLDTDFLLALLRDALTLQPSLKVVLMSATLDENVFVSYFDGHVGRVHIEGRTFPVEDCYLDEVLNLAQDGTLRIDETTGEPFETDGNHMGQAIRELGIGINYKLIADLVGSIDKQLKVFEGGAHLASGAILIFLPGTMEIDRCLKALERCPNIYSLPLHASLTSAEQRRVFQTPPSGKRKVIAATNVAETSITIEDVVAVVDTGRVKETQYDPANNIVRLQEVWASQAACEQRRGRAGRVRAGRCYRLFTKNVWTSMSARPEPEIRRVPLEQLCLAVKATGTSRDIADFLSRTLSPPSSGAVSNAIRALHRMSALESDQLTALGTYLSMIPADLRCSKLLVYACIFGCLEPCLTIASILTVKSPFVSPRDKREEAKEARASFSSVHGDLLLDLAAYDEWTRISDTSRNTGEVYRWCGSKFLSHQILRDIASTRTQLLDALKDTGLVRADYRVDSKGPDVNPLMLRGLIAGALQPQVAQIQFPDKKYIASMSGAKELDPEAKTIKYFNEENGRVFVHPSSAVFDAQLFSHSATYLSYFTKLATSKIFIRDLTPFNAYGLLLFGGPIELDAAGQGLIVDGWLRLKGWARIGVLVSRLRTLLDAALRRRIDAPETATMDDKLLGIVKKLLELNGQDQ